MSLISAGSISLDSTCKTVIISVAGPGCLSRFLILTIPDPESRIPFPTTTTTEEEGETYLYYRSLAATNFTKLKIILFLKKIEPSDKKLY
jgi:hypothetical protein